MAAADLILGDTTKGRILEELITGPRTARDLASVLKIRESAVRTHLERMVERGIVQPSFHREGVGRPRKRFSLTPEGFELFPRRYEMLLDTLVEVLLEREGEGYVSTLFMSAARRFAEKLASEIPRMEEGASERERLEAVVRILNKLGQRAHLESSGGTPRIVRRNCVFRVAAMKHAYLLCDVFDQHFLESLLGQAGVGLTESVPRGGHTCTHLIHLGPA
jgi:predicted ArsR family transcriptional regulator